MTERNPLTSILLLGSEAGGFEFEGKLNYTVSSKSRPGCIARPSLENKRSLQCSKFHRRWWGVHETPWTCVNCNAGDQEVLSQIPLGTLAVLGPWAAARGLGGRGTIPRSG